MKFGHAWGLAWNLSWTLLFSLVVPLFLGIWLDKKFGTTPLFILIGAGVGVLAATVGVARIALRSFAPMMAQDPDRETGTSNEEEPE